MNTEPKPDWIGKSDIAEIPGALKPSAYVARAYKTTQKTGTSPDWARKLDSGKWLFNRQHIETDARYNLEHINISDAAGLLGATRRTVQTWIDTGIIIATNRPDGARRVIRRDVFQRQLPDLKKRLQTPAVAGRKLKRGETLPPRVEKALAKQKQESGDARKRRKREKQAAQRNAGRDAKERSQLEAQLRTATTAKMRAAAERQAALKETANKAAREKKAIAAEAKLVAAQQTRLKAARNAKLKAAGERRAAAAKATEKAAEERASAAMEARLRADLDARLHQERRLAAASVEEELKQARDHALEATTYEKISGEVAERIFNDMLDERINRADAVTLFDRIVAEKDIPDSIRIKIRKQYFGS